ncbi:MAG TPA: DUF4328 domain-containing protein [Pyrinomonadaceae bacterium]|nr:DUF4328 domain-containing protein [Pyrinomonadaceae bacterium]
MQPPLTAHTPFRSGRKRAAAASILLAASLSVNLLGALATLIEIVNGSATRPASNEEVSVFDLVEVGIGLLHIVVFIATVVAFCMWIHRAYANLPALGNPKPALKHSPWWAVGSFFVPFANLVIPYRAVKEVWSKSDPTVSTDYYVAPQEASAPLVMSLWWAFWLISNFVNNAAFRLRLEAKSAQQFLVAAYLDLFGSLLLVPAAAFAISVVREINNRQDERSKRVNYLPQAPPPPPIFRQPQDTEAKP